MEYLAVAVERPTTAATVAARGHLRERHADPFPRATRARGVNSTEGVQASGSQGFGSPTWKRATTSSPAIVLHGYDAAFHQHPRVQRVIQGVEGGVVLLVAGGKLLGDRSARGCAPAAWARTRGSAFARHGSAPMKRYPHVGHAVSGQNGQRGSGIQPKR